MQFEQKYSTLHPIFRSPRTVSCLMPYSFIYMSLRVIIDTNWLRIEYTCPRVSPFSRQICLISSELSCLCGSSGAVRVLTEAWLCRILKVALFC